jgi:hypothetical protein
MRRPCGGYELQINNEELDYATGSIEGYIQRLKEVSPTPDRWHSLEGEAVGDHSAVRPDGVKVPDGRDAKFKSGYIGLQCHKGSQIEPRKLKLRPLSRSAKAGAGARCEDATDEEMNLSAEQTERLEMRHAP